MMVEKAFTTWSEEDMVAWENMDAPTRREYVLGSALGHLTDKPSTWVSKKEIEKQLGGTK